MVNSIHSKKQTMFRVILANRTGLIILHYQEQNCNLIRTPSKSLVNNLQLKHKQFDFNTPYVHCQCNFTVAVILTIIIGLSSYHTCNRQLTRIVIVLWPYTTSYNHKILQSMSLNYVCIYKEMHLSLFSLNANILQ